MTPTIVSLLAVTLGFAALVLWVYWPSNRSRFEAHGRIPFDDDAEQTANDKKNKDVSP